MANRSIKEVIDQIRRDRSLKFVSSAELDELLATAGLGLRFADRADRAVEQAPKVEKSRFDEIESRLDEIEAKLRRHELR